MNIPPIYRVISHFLQKGKRFTAHGRYQSAIKAFLPLALQTPLEYVGVEDDSEREKKSSIQICKNRMMMMIKIKNKKEVCLAREIKIVMEIPTQRNYNTKTIFK